MFKLKNLLFSIFFIFIFFVFLDFKKVDAQSNRGIILSGLEINDKPIDSLIFEFNTIKKGDILSGKFNVTHDLESVQGELNLQIDAYDFSQDGNQGVPLILPKTALPENSKASNWITFKNGKNLVLDKIGATKTVEFEIKIPLNADPGGKYVSIFLSKVTDELKSSQNVQFSLQSNIGTLVFFTVEGNLTKNLVIEDIYLLDIENKKRTFFFNLPVKLVVKIKNTGNTHVSPRGMVYFHQDKNFTTNNLKTFDFNPVNPSTSFRDLILPNSSREFIFIWNDGFSVDTSVDGKIQTNYFIDKISRLRFGNYTATTQIDWVNEQNRSSGINQNSVDFFVFPIYIMVIIIFAILTISAVIYLFLRKKYEKRI